MQPLHRAPSPKHFPTFPRSTCSALTAPPLHLHYVEFYSKVGPQTYLLRTVSGIWQTHSFPSVLPSPESPAPSPHLAMPENSQEASFPRTPSAAIPRFLSSRGNTESPKPHRAGSLPTPLPGACRSATTNGRRVSYCAGGPAGPAARPRWVRTFQPAELLLSPLSLK